MIDELIGVLYPKLCITCQDTLLKNEAFVCTGCLLNLPQTHYHKEAENPITVILRGRLAVKQAFAFLHFKKSGMVQQLLHELKYRGNKELALFLGQYYGSILRETFQADAFVAVPLHKSKLRKRGYNQSLFFAEGLSETMNIPNWSHVVKRVTATETQTKKSRFERWVNVDEAFVIEDSHSLEGKHIVIVDDVITTGSTIEALAQQFPASCHISVCAISSAVY